MDHPVLVCYYYEIAMSKLRIASLRLVLLVSQDPRIVGV